MSKVKAKKPGKSGKLDPRNMDLSELRKPIKIGVSSLKKAAELLTTGTPEIQDLLSYEVNLLYECRICRSIFRSLLNLISHKRRFCQEKFNGSGNRSRDYGNSENITTEDLESPELDQFTLDSLMNPSKNDRILRSQAPIKATKTDLTSVVHMLQKKQVEQLGDISVDTSQSPVEETNCQQVVLQVLDTQRAAYQTLVQPNLSPSDLMENQVIELDNILSNDSVVLRADGQIEKSDSPLQFYGVNENKLVCDICSLTFMTQKTLDSHFRIKHAAVRDCYLCPINSCTASFSSTMGVKRHLTNDHRKVGQELKTLSQQVEKRTIRSKPLPLVVNKKPKKPENFDNSVETQQWVERMDTKALHECISCGEKFHGKSELVIHLKHCFGHDEERKNNILYEDDPELEANMIDEIREIPVLNISNEDQPDSSGKTMPDITLEREGSSLHIQRVSRISEEEWRKIPEKFQIRSYENDVIIEEIPSKSDKSRGTSSVSRKSNRPLITENIVVTGNYFEQTRKRKSASLETNTVTGEKLKKLPSHESKTDKATTTSSSQRISDTIALMSDHHKLECITCRMSFLNITSLNRHNMESHIKINRFRCNKCDFKSVLRNDCVGHCNKEHNARNSRQVLNGMISQISQDQSRETETVDLSSLNSTNTRRANNSQVDNSNSTINVMHSRNSAIMNSEPKNPSDTDTEPEDREAIYRRIDSNPNLQEMIREIVGTNSTSTASTSNVNGELHLTNNNVDRLRKSEANDYSPDFRNSKFNNIFPVDDDDDDIDEELDHWDRKNNLSRASNVSESRKRSLSRASNLSESLMQLRSSSRLSRKLVSSDDDDNDDDEEDEITPELYRGNSNSDRQSSRSHSRLSVRRNSQIEGNESRRVTRSQSRLSNKLTGDIDDSLFDPSPETPSEIVIRPKSRAKKEEIKEKRGRGRPKKNETRSAPAKINVKKNSESLRRRESFSSESSQNQRPIRSRVKHVEKDFVYDLEDENLQKSKKSGSLTKNASNSQIAQNGSSRNSNFIRNLFRNVSDDEESTIFQTPGFSVEQDNSESEFRGFPRQPEVLSIE